MRGNLRSLTDSGKRTLSMRVHAFLVFVALLIFLPAALSSMPVALVCASALVITTLALIFGLGRTGSGFLIVAFGTVPLNDVHPIGSLSSLELADMFFITGFLLLLPRLATATVRVPRALLFGGGGMLTVGTLSALASDQPRLNFGFLLDVAIGVVLLTILLARWQPGRRTVIAAAAAYMFGNAVNVAFSLFQGHSANGRYAGLTSHPNVMGLTQVLGLALAPFLLEALPRRFRWIVALGSFVCAYGIWISGSRAALGCAVIMTLLYPLYKRSIPVALAVAVMSLPAIVVVNRVAQNPDPSNPLGRLLGAGSAGESNEAREAGARAGIEQFLSHPLLGDGWATIWGAHDVYLQIAAGIGMFGLACYLVMLVPILRPLIVVPRPYGLLAAPGLASVLIALVDPAFGSRYIWSVVALALSADRLAALAEEPSNQVEDSAVQPRHSTFRSVEPGGDRHVRGRSHTSTPYA
jgi:O-antigen ligase